ncbi:MAG TPA: PASTA domain-containing protein, partial [Nocardioides sp.]|nr:PASTA domain-containing protein [Nocardioides sp.]
DQQRSGWLAGNRLLVASRALLILALVGAGILVGWALGSDEDLVEAEPAPPKVSSTTSAAPTGPVMPDVRGLATDDARQVIADVGVDAADVTVTNAAAAGESGLVIAQTPVYGYPIDGPITIAVSSPAEVPKFAGRAAEEVLDELDELGARVETTTVYLPDVPVGQIAAIEPAPGNPLPETVSVTISAEPDELPMTEVSAVESSCFTDDDSLNGTTFADLLVCETDRDVAEQTWLIRRAGSRLTAVVGIPDSQDPDSPAMTVEVVGDGRVLTSLTAAYGTTQPLDVDVSGVLRLTIRYRSTTQDYGYVGLGQLTLLGDADALAGLTS